MTSIRIKEVAIYHPDNMVDNQYYIDHFKKQGKDISKFIEIMGRNRRYIIDNEEENTLTMGIEATMRVLEKANMVGKDIDLIVFSTQVPEHTFPTNAMFVHHAIGGKERTTVLDSNANCAGMTVAVEQASRYLLSNPHMQNALIIGSDYNSIICDPNNEMTYTNYGDAAAAIILEKTEEDCGFIDSIFSVNSDYRNNIIYPATGLKNALMGKDNMDYIKWVPFDGSMAMPDTYRMIEELLERNHVGIDEIGHFCFSQFAQINILKIQEHFHIPDEKIAYIGDQFGYTGTSSPFIALNDSIEKNKIKRGDYILFWTLGAGHQLVAMLFKY